MYMQEGLHLLIAQTETLDWLEVQLFLKEELKFVSITHGVVSVIIPGVLPLQVLSVASWDFSELVSSMHYLSYTISWIPTGNSLFMAWQ